MTRQSPRSSTVHLRPIVAAVLALGLALAIATVAWAAPSLSIDSGPSGPTQDTMPLFGFTVDPDATVECSIDQGAAAYGPCTSPSTHAPGAPLPDGEYVFRVQATDAAQEQTVETQTFSVDTTPPSLSIDSGPAGPTNDSTPSFGFTAEPGATVECSVDQGTPAYGPCTTATSHTATTLDDGTYVFRVRATDAAGNQAEASQGFVVDTAAPSLSIDSGPAGPTSASTPSFGFTAEAGATLECSIDQGSSAYGPCTTTTSHTAATPLADGSYVFRVRATDGVGNRASASRTFSVDTTPPSLSIGSGPSGPTSDATPSFGFTAQAGATVECSVDQGTPAYGPCSTATSHTAALFDGAYVFRVRATDAAGNQAGASRSFSVDTVPPAVGGISGPAGPTNDATPSFGFTAESGATLECSIDHGTPAYGPCTTATSHTATTLDDGSYHFRVRATDAAGNRATAVQDFSVDSAAPSLSIDSGPAGPTNDSTPSFGFTAESGATVECSVDHGTPAYGPCTGTTTHVIGTPRPDGTYVFRVRATSAVGNRAIASRTFTIDTVAPSLSIGFGPSATTNDSTPLFGFSAEVGVTLECSIDQGAPAFGPCASATTDAAVAPLVDGAYVFRVRATDMAGNRTIVTRAFTVDTLPQTPPGTPDPTPPVKPKPSVPRLLSPFPLVRIAGTLTSTGVRIRLLSVHAPRGALVRITVTPACSGKRHSSRRCRVLRAAGTVGRRAAIDFRGLAHAYRSGTVIVVRVWRADRIGKYTRFTIVRGKAPRRVDQCLVPAATRGSRCPSS